MKPLFDPSLISLDNAAEDFWQEYKRKQGLPVERVSDADRKFIESMDKIREANANVKKRFSWAGLLALLAVAAVVMLLTYWAVEGF